MIIILTIFSEEFHCDKFVLEKFYKNLHVTRRVHRGFFNVTKKGKRYSEHREQKYLTFRGEKSQKSTIGVHEPRPSADDRARPNDLILVERKKLAAVHGQEGSKVLLTTARYKQLSFSTSKFDVDQINTLRPATFEVVPVDRITVNIAGDCSVRGCRLPFKLRSFALVSFFSFLFTASTLPITTKHSFR